MPKLEEKQISSGSQNNLARASGDIAAMINKQTLDGHFVSPSLSEKQEKGQNALKSLESIIIEGNFKVRKIFSSRTAITNDVNTDFTESVSKTQPLPRGLDFLSSVNKVNQVLNYDAVVGMSKLAASVEDSMMVTGIKMSGFGKANPNVTASSS